MAAYTKYNSFVDNLCNKNFDLFNISVASSTTIDTCKAVIHTDAPGSTDTTLANLSEIGGSNGYTTGGTDIAMSASTGTQNSGTVTASATDVTWTASGGSLGASTTGRYFSIYDDTATAPLADPLICSFDYGATFTVATGETMTLDFGVSLFTLT